jgi:hypothetical protein
VLDNLNRTGIALNFIAGFLLAPELIGEARLRRGESWLRSNIESLNFWCGSVSRRLMDRLKIDQRHTRSSMIIPAAPLIWFAIMALIHIARGKQA